MRTPPVLSKCNTVPTGVSRVAFQRGALHKRKELPASTARARGQMQLPERCNDSPLYDPGMLSRQEIMNPQSSAGGDQASTRRIPDGSSVYGLEDGGADVEGISFEI